MSISKFSMFPFAFLGRYNYLFNGALIKPRWGLTVANVLHVKKGAKPIKPHKLRVVLGTFNFRHFSFPDASFLVEMAKESLKKWIPTEYLCLEKTQFRSGNVESHSFVPFRHTWATRNFNLTTVFTFSFEGEFNRNKLDGSETPIRVKRIVIHPGYDRYSMAHNIALLELEKPVKLNDHIRMVS